MIQTGSELTKALLDTKSWCLPKLDKASPEHCFRSPGLKKYVVEYKSFTDCTSFWPSATEIDFTLAAREIEPAADEANIKGRLLLCFPDWSNHNAIACTESSSYLDEHDIPPWDTWVATVDIPGSGFLLLAWVPIEFVELVELGIQSECVGMLHWANSTYWGEFTTPDDETLDIIPKWILEHSAAKT